MIGELALGLVRDISPPGASEAYRTRALPTFAIAGTRAAWLDSLRDPQRRAELAASHPRIRGVEIVDLEGGGHFPHRDDPDAYVENLTRFLAGR